MTTFNDAIRLMKEMESGGLFSPQANSAFLELWEYARLLDETGQELLSSKDDEYLLSMIQLLQSISFTVLVKTGENISDCMMLHIDPLVAKYMTIVVKLALGLSVMEELR